MADHAKVARIARHIFEGHEQRRPFERLRGELAPASLSEAYDVQDEVRRLFRDAGWGEFAGTRSRGPPGSSAPPAALIRLRLAGECSIPASPMPWSIFLLVLPTGRQRVASRLRPSNPETRLKCGRCKCGHFARSRRCWSRTSAIDDLVTPVGTLALTLFHITRARGVICWPAGERRSWPGCPHSDLEGVSVVVAAVFRIEREIAEGRGVIDHH